MNDLILSASALPEPLPRMIRTEKVRIHESTGGIWLTPVEESFDCTAGLCGMLAEYDIMSVDKFLKRKHAEKELEF